MMNHQEDEGSTPALTQCDTQVKAVDFDKATPPPPTPSLVSGVDATNDDSNRTDLSLSSQGLVGADLENLLKADLSVALSIPLPLPIDAPPVCSWSQLRTLDLSRNKLMLLPPCIGNLIQLESLNVSRNSLRGLPIEIGQLKALVHLNALSNNMRLRLLPIPELAQLPALQELDVRYNSKLKQAAKDALESSLGGGDVKIHVTLPKDPSTTDTTANNKTSAGERDATLLRSQLEPLSTPQLRKRLERTFGISLMQEDKEGDEKNNENAFDRGHVMQRLLACYTDTPRTIRCERGVPGPEAILQELLAEFETLVWPAARERPKISAQHYMILQKPLTAADADADTTTNTNMTARERKEAIKLNRYQGIWNKAVQAITQVDSEFAQRFTALAVTKNFQGSPHIDTLNVGPFYAISMGNFSTGGGRICVECSPTIVAEVDTRGRMAKVDGRFPHWVSAFEGTRYSLIYYVTSGTVIPQTTAVFEPAEQEEGAPPWIPPPTFVL
jgi:hypothetical protein